MVATNPDGFSLRGWKAKRCELGGFYIYAPGAGDTLRGHALTEKVAIEWLEEASGITYEKLPPITREELIVRVGPTERLSEFPCRGTYQLTHYYHGDKYLGKVQVKRRGHRIEILTAAGNVCVRGCNLKWLCEQNGLRLVESVVI